MTKLLIVITSIAIAIAVVSFIGQSNDWQMIRMVAQFRDPIVMIGLRSGLSLPLALQMSWVVLTLTIAIPLMIVTLPFTGRRERDVLDYITE